MERDSSVVHVGGTPVGLGHRCFIIAEAGVNHNGDQLLAHQLIDLAAECGADAVKFQTFKPASVTSRSAPRAEYQRATDQSETQMSLLERLTLPEEAWPDLAAHAHDKGLRFLSTPFDTASLDLLVSAGVDALKIPSGELDNLSFIREVAQRALPVILSTGMGTMDEVDSAVEVLRSSTHFAILHCVSAYPAAIHASNLRAIQTLAKRHSVPVGWSDHTVGVITALGAVALGAAVLEKHLTLDNAMEGPDHRCSADPAAMRAYVEAVRALESALGDGVKVPVAEERETRELARRSYHAARDLNPGQRVSEDDLILIRPAIGVSPSVDLVGRVVKRSVKAGSPIVWSDLV